MRRQGTRIGADSTISPPRTRSSARAALTIVIPADDEIEKPAEVGHEATEEAGSSAMMASRQAEKGRLREAQAGATDAEGM